MKCERCGAEPSEANPCYTCQELEIITALGEVQFTEKLRRKFSKPIKVEKPDVVRPLPWSAKGDIMLSSDGKMVGRFVAEEDCVFASKSASAHQDLLLVLAVIHERIRTGRSFYLGSEQDIALWCRVKELTK